MMRRHYFTLLCFLLAAHVTGCRTTPRPDERPNASVVPPPVVLDSSRTAVLPVAPTPALLPRLTDAIGISTPAGRQRRQAVRLARASVPHLGKGAVYAVNSTVTSGFKASAPITTADTGATVSNATGSSQQQTVKGNANQLKADKHDTTVKPGFWNSPAGYTVAALLAGIGGYGLYLAWPVLVALLPRRRKSPSQPLSPDNGQPS